jgi:hypothetical protein
VKEEWGIVITTKTIKRILKTLLMSWHRMRRDVGGEPKPEEYIICSKVLKELNPLPRLTNL